MSKVLHLINDFSVERGGAQKILNLMGEVESEVDNVESYTFCQSSSAYINSNKDFIGGRFWFISLLILIFKLRPELVIIHTRSFLPVVVFLKIFGCKTIFYCHACYRKYNFLFRVFKCDKYVAVSMSVKSLLQQSGVFNVEVICNPVFKPAKDLFESSFLENSGVLTVNYVGSLKSWKGIDKLAIFLADYSDFSKQYIELNIVGDGGLKTEIENISTASHYLSIKFHGYKENPFYCLSNSCIHIVPSLEEGFGLVGLEAIMHGNVVMFSDIDALTEVLSDDNFCVPFSIYDYASFTSAFEYSIELSRKLFSEQQADRIKRVVDNFGFDSFTHKYVNLINADNHYEDN